MLHIFHLEDDNSLQDILKVALTTADPQVNLRQFINSDDAVHYIQQNLPEIDLFVLDIRVPGKLDGMGVAKTIRDLGSDAPIVVASAYEKPGEDQLAVLGCEWMPKPWSLDLMMGLIPIAQEHNLLRRREHN